MKRRSTIRKADGNVLASARNAVAGRLATQADCETESALLSGLLHPERNPRIPIVMVEAGQFDSRWARRWWNSVLELEVVNCAGETESEDVE